MLLAPAAYPVDASSDNGGTGDNYTNTTLSDQCTTLITSGTAPFTGCFKPEDTFGGAIKGSEARGKWRLEAIDDNTAELGTFNNWSLALCVSTCGDGIITSSELCDEPA